MESRKLSRKQNQNQNLDFLDDAFGAVTAYRCGQAMIGPKDADMS
jgi:hypothetical protein